MQKWTTIIMSTTTTCWTLESQKESEPITKITLMRHNQ